MRNKLKRLTFHRSPQSLSLQSHVMFLHSIFNITLTQLSFSIIFQFDITSIIIHLNLFHVLIICLSSWYSNILLKNTFLKYSIKMKVYSMHTNKFKYRVCEMKLLLTLYMYYTFHILIVAFMWLNACTFELFKVQFNNINEFVVRMVMVQIQIRKH